MGRNQLLTRGLIGSPQYPKARNIDLCIVCLDSFLEFKLQKDII